MHLASKIYSELIQSNPDITDDEVAKSIREVVVPNSNIKYDDNRRLPRVRKKINE